MRLHETILADYSQLSLEQLRILRKNLDATEAQHLVKLLDAQSQIEAVNAELVQRYQAEPRLALELLPQN